MSDADVSMLKTLQFTIETQKALLEDVRAHSKAQEKTIKELRAEMSKVREERDKLVNLREIAKKRKADAAAAEGEEKAKEATPKSKPKGGGALTAGEAIGAYTSKKSKKEAEKEEESGDDKKPAKAPQCRICNKPMKGFDHASCAEKRAKIKEEKAKLKEKKEKAKKKDG